MVAAKKASARLEAKEAAAKAKAKKEEERVAELKKVRGEKWLPSVACALQVDYIVFSCSVFHSCVTHELDKSLSMYIFAAEQKFNRENCKIVNIHPFTKLVCQV